ncbi:MAG: alpha/beta hydrolase family protein [Phycisphaerae bacterium]
MAVSRNLSVNAYFRRMAARHTPQFRFKGKTRADWQRWRKALHPAVIATLGRMPSKVPLRPEVQAQWEEEGLVKQRVIFDVEDGLSAVAYVLRPAGAEGRLPGILACHGHGRFGKEPVMGSNEPNAKQDIESHNYDYGRQMAKAGYAVIGIDWRGFGERDDRRKPNFNDITWGRDICNLHYLRATIMGMTVLGMDIHDGMCAIDYLCSQSFVDPGRIGVMGLSFGGTMTTWMSLAEPRIKAADIMCYSDMFAAFGMRDTNFCGSQVTPGLYALCDVPDLQGLSAPKPLLVEIGTYDDCFALDTAMTCFREVEKIYAAAGAREKLWLDLFEGGHRWGANKSVEFFGKYL